MHARRVELRDAQRHMRGTSRRAAPRAIGGAIVSSTQLSVRIFTTMWLQVALTASLALAPRPSVPQVRAAPDSVRAHRLARSAQQAFEQRRRHLLPVVPGGSRGRCDVRLGRFCYWHDDGDAQPPDEPTSIALERTRLTSRLDSLARLSPADGWIAGQRVRYLVEAGRFAEAVEAAAACGGEWWWCRALEGFALHARGDRVGADSSFSSALAAMPNDQRCEWEDLATMLPDRAARRWRDLDCAARRAVADTLWWLAQPQWTVAGNDRRSEHFARHVMSRLERDSRSPYDMSWGKDTHELLVRYGWPSAWSRDFGSVYDMSAIHVIGHEPHPAFDFVPGDSALAAPVVARRDGWSLRNPIALSRYAPRDARAFVTIDGQLARFPRGDSMLVFGVADVRGDSVLQGSDVAAAMAASAAPNAAVTVAPGNVAGGRVVTRLRVPNAPTVLSLELRDTVKREAGRLREGVGALHADDNGSMLSDVLLYEEPRPTDGTLDDVLPRAIGRLRVARRGRIGAFWEFWRASATIDSVTYTVTVMPRDASWLRRLAARAGLAAAQAPVHMRFTEPIGDAAITARALAVDLSSLPGGRYDVRLQLETTRGGRGEALRTIEIRD